MARLVALLALGLVCCISGPTFSPKSPAGTKKFVDALSKRTVKLEICNGGRGWGSGVILGRHSAGVRMDHDGAFEAHDWYLVATAAHVWNVAVRRGCGVRIYGNDVALVAKDDTQDWALVRVQLRRSYDPIRIARKPYVGMRVWAFGYPRQYIKRGKPGFQVTSGLLISDARGLYRVGASWDRGASGGPVFDDRGELVCLVRSVALIANTFPIPDHSFCTPAKRFRKAMNKYLWK